MSHWVRHVGGEIDIGLDESALASAQSTIQNAINQVGISQADLARKMNCHRSFVSRMLSGNHNLTIKTMSRALAACDRKAGTIIEVASNGREIVVQEDSAIRTDGNGQSEAQSYRYERNPEGVKHRFSLRKNGRWINRNDKMSNGTGLSLDERDEYYDFSF